MVWSIFSGFSFSFFRNTEYCRLKQLATTAWLSLRETHARLASHGVSRVIQTPLQASSRSDVTHKSISGVSLTPNTRSRASKHRCNMLCRRAAIRTRETVSRFHQTLVRASRNTATSFSHPAANHAPWTVFQTRASGVPRCVRTLFFAVCNLKLWRPILMYTFTGESIKARRDFLVQ